MQGWRHRKVSWKVNLKMHPVRCIINCSTGKLLLLRGRAKLPKRWKFAMKLRLISLTPFPLSLVRTIYLGPLARSPLLAAMPEFLSGGVTRGLSIAEESSTLQPFPPSLPASIVCRLSPCGTGRNRRAATTFGA